MQTPGKVSILLAEDNDDHVFLMKRAFRENDTESYLTVVGDGEAVMTHLENCAAAEELPNLIVLDVNMPKMDGFETLDAVKSHKRFRHIPVVILTSSSREVDIAKSYSEGACSYISKPGSFDEFRALIRHFHAYWTDVAELPKEAPSA